MKKVIIVGASSGIGRALAILFARQNWMVGVTGRRKELLDELYDLYPEQVVPLAFDNTKEDATHKLQLLISKLGGLDLLVLSSGTGNINSALDWSIEEDTLLLNVVAWTRIADYTFNYFNAQGSGHFAAITSIAAIRGEGRAPAYNASKSFQANYLQGLRKMAIHKKLRISITDIQPGFVHTTMAKGTGRFWEASPEKAARQMLPAILHKRKKVYITKRWWFIAQILKVLPDYLYNRV